MSDDIVKALLESLTPDQKEDLIKGILNSNVKGGETPKTKDVEETVSSFVSNVSTSLTLLFSRPLTS